MDALHAVALSYGVNEPYLTYLQIQWGLRRKLTYAEIVLITNIMRDVQKVMDD